MKESGSLFLATENQLTPPSSNKPLFILQTFVNPNFFRVLNLEFSDWMALFKVFFETTN